MGDRFLGLVPLDQDPVLDLASRVVPDTVRNEVPDLLEEAPRPAEAVIAEVAAFLERPQEHQIHPEGVGPPLRDVLVGDHDIAARLRHLGPVLHDGAVSTELGERLVEVDVAQLVQHHRDEAGVEQVQHRMLVAADVGGDRAAIGGCGCDRTAGHRTRCWDSAGSTRPSRGRCPKRRSRGGPGRRIAGRST